MGIWKFLNFLFIHTSDCWAPLWDIGDKKCDREANKEKCNWDGGDCCLKFIEHDCGNFNGEIIMPMDDCICHLDGKLHPENKCLYF